MDRLNVDLGVVATLRSQLQNQPVLASKSEPLPGTAVKLDDDVEWLGICKMRVLWGYETADFFYGFCPEIDPDGYSYFEGQYITDRAPADPQETAMPIYPQQAQQKQAGPKYDPKKALQNLLHRLQPDAAKRVRALVRERRPELLTDEHAAKRK